MVAACDGMAERAGFEPARSWRPLRDFQSRPFDRSGTSPRETAFNRGRTFAHYFGSDLA